MGQVRGNFAKPDNTRRAARSVGQETAEVIPDFHEIILELWMHSEKRSTYNRCSKGLIQSCADVVSGLCLVVTCIVNALVEAREDVVSDFAAREVATEDIFEREGS